MKIIVFAIDELYEETPEIGSTSTLQAMECKSEVIEIYHKF